MSLLLLGLELPEDWREATIADVTSKVGSGATPRGGASVYVDRGAAFIRSQNVLDHEFSGDGLAHISDLAASQLRGAAVESRDVLLNITGDSILRTTIVPESILPAHVSQHVAIVRSNGAVHPVFLQKWLSSPAMKKYMLGHSSGGTRKAITKGHILSFPVPIPPIDEQDRIARVLQALDDRAASNRRAIELMEQLGEAILDNTLDRDVFGAPHYDRERRLGDYLSVLETGSRPRGGAAVSDVGVVSLGAENVQSAGVSKATQFKRVPQEFGAAMKRGRLVNEDVLVYKDGGKPGNFVPHVSAFGYGFPVDEATINEHVFRVRSEPGVSQALLYWLLRSAWMDQEMRKRGTGVAIPGLNGSNFRSLPVPEIDQMPLDRLNDQLSPLFAEMLRRGAENSRLAKLRDALLPELVSGRIRVPEPPRY